MFLQARLERMRSETDAMQRDLAEKLWDAEQRARCVLMLRCLAHLAYLAYH
jgi:hypothetical protein